MRLGRLRLVLISGVVAASIVSAPSPVALAEPRTVRVGVYENEPKVFTDEDGRPTGIFIDLIDEIAEEEGWRLEYVPGTWAEGLSALEAGDIDLMPDVGYTPERDERYDFCERPVIESWSYVYSAPGKRADTVSELEGMRVAVLEGSVQETAVERMVEGFELDVTLVPASSFADAFALVEAGDADAAVANYFFGDRFQEEYGLEKTPIVFNEIPLHYAVAEGRNADLLEAIDRVLAAWIDEPGSVYYDTLRRYTIADEESSVLVYVLWAVGGLAALLGVAIAAILLLRWQVDVRTRDLLKAQTELEEHRARLEQLVEDRTAQLERANERLAASSRSKSEFLTLMTHELRSQLNSIVGLSGHALRDAPRADESVRHALAVINDAGTELLRLITSVLTLAKMDAGGIEVSEAPFDLRQTVRDVIETLGIQAEERGLELTTALPDREVMLVSDEHLVRQIIVNFLSNAIEYTDSGTVDVELSDAGASVQVRVRDTGRGIKPEVLERLFSAPWDAPDGRSTDERGSGLGLTIAARMADLIGATIRATSVPGRGSTFTLALPAVTSD